MLTKLIAPIALAALIVPTAAASSLPALRLVTRQPLVVRGSHFKSGERVRVTAGGRVVVRSVSSAGVFTAGFGDTDPCTSLVVRALGSRGDRAVLVLKPQPLCPVP